MAPQRNHDHPYLPSRWRPQDKPAVETGHLLVVANARLAAVVARDQGKREQPAEYCQVIDSIGWICEAMEVKPRLEFTGGERGWVGDNPFIFLDTQRVRALDWQPRLSIREAVQATVRYLLQNRALLDSRE